MSSVHLKGKESKLSEGLRNSLSATHVQERLRKAFERIQGIRGNAQHPHSPEATKHNCRT